MVCMKLHNLCIDRNVEVSSDRFLADVCCGDQWAVYDKTREDDVFLRGRATGDHRRDITAKLVLLDLHMRDVIVA
jgi:hypothetical protein